MYTVRQAHYGIFEIARFEDRKLPDSVYVLRNNRCSCPAGRSRKRCKHFAIIDCFKSLDEGAWWFEESNGVVTPHVALCFEIA